MNRQVILAGFLTAVLGSGGALYGLATEHIGPGPGGSQPDWPKGLTELAAHQTRVYSFWVNGNEDFYFWADADEVNKLLALFAKMEMEQYRVWVRSEEKGIETLLDVDEHKVWIRSDKGQAKTFSGGEIEFNVQLHVPGGILLAFSRGKSPSDEPPEYPRLTVHLREDQVSWSQLKIPKNVALQDAGAIKAIGSWRRSEIRPFTLGQLENVNLFYPMVVSTDGQKAYPVVVETLQLAKTGSNLHCVAKVSEDRSAKDSFTLEVEVFGEQGSQKKMTELQGKGRYDLDFGPIGRFADAKQFAVTLARIEPWGGAVGGVALRLTSDKQLFSDDEVVSLKVEARNEGKDKTLLPVHENGFQLVLDGKKYHWASKDQLSFIVGYDNLAAGEKRGDIPITVDQNEWLCNEDSQYLDIEPGEHAVRVVSVPPAPARLKLVPSNPVPVWVQKKAKKVRRLYYGRVLFDDGKPAVVPSLRLKPSITKWYADAAEGKRVVTVEDDGYFVAPISDEDMDRLKSGDCWLTVHFANDPWRQDAGKDDLRFPVELLATQRDKAGAVTIRRPGIYYGRVLFDDGTPPVLDPEPWPGAKIHIDIPFDSTDVDEQGYFCAYFSDKQFEQLKAKGAKFGIYCPRYEERQVSSEVAKFPVELMSTDKTKAGAIKIQKPIYKPQIDLANAPSLQGKALPEFGGIKIDFQPEHVKGKMLLICFWDMQQRPSRNCLRQLSTRAQELEAKDVVVVPIQAAKVDENALNKWVKENNIPFPVGIAEGDAEKVRFAWGVQSLPWLILSDPEHIVRAEGFALSDLDEKIKENEPSANTAGGSDKVTGLVRDPEGQALSNVRVTEFLTDKEYVTDPDGKFVSAFGVSGNARYFFAVHHQRKLVGVGQLPAGQRHVEIDLVSAKMVSGTVVDPDGKPVAGAQVAPLPMTCFYVLTDNQGRFDVGWNSEWAGDLKEYFLMARHLERNLAGGIEMTEETETVQVKVEPALTLTGIVSDPNDNPIVAATVGVSLRKAWACGTPVGPALTDGKGRYEFRALPQRQEWIIYARADGYVERRATTGIINTIVQREDGGQIILKRPVLSVSGVVLDDAGKPVTNCQVGLRGEGQPERTATTDAQGKFTLEKICVGSIEIWAKLDSVLYGTVEAQAGRKDVKLVVLPIR